MADTERTLRVRKRAVVQDLGNITLEDSWVGGDALSQLIGVNGNLKAGIATELELGLTSDRFVLVPVMDELHDSQKVSVAMIGLLTVRNQNDEPVPGDIMTNALAEEIYKAYARYFEDIEKYKRQAAAVRLDTRRYEEALAKDPAVRSEIEKALAKGPPPLKAKKPELKDYQVRGLYASDKAHIPLGMSNTDEDLSEMTAVCMRLNQRQFNADFATDKLKKGQLDFAAHTVAIAWRTGLLEPEPAAEHVRVAVSRSVSGDWKVAAIDPLYAKRVNQIWKTGDIINKKDLKMSPKLSEVAYGAVINSGFTHYGYNHTTGGAELNGANAAALALNGLFYPNEANARPLDASVANAQVQTNLVYNCLHPVNKRGIANIAILGSRVFCWRKPALCPTMRKTEFDSFIRMRQAVIPAGSHKVYLANLVLAKILDAGLAVFLPWYNEIDNLINMMNELSTSGARAHPGAKYYTDEPNTFSQTNADSYLPDLAYYVRAKLRRSTLVDSPHFSAQNASMADDHWINLIESIVAKPVGAVDPEKLAQYQETIGTKLAKIDFAKPENFPEVFAAQRAKAEEIRNAGIAARRV